VRRAALVLGALLAACAAPGREVALDVGHYAAEPGAISASGVPEFDYNLALAQRLRAALEREGLRVRMIGERGDYDDLRARTRAARGASLLVSIHHDSVKQRLLAQAQRFSGFALFVSHRNPRAAQSLACASAIGARLRAAGFSASRYHADPGVGEGRPFADEANGVHWFDDLVVAASATMPAVLLEAGVIVNPQEERRMAEAGVRESIARAVAQGVEQCLS
jgi:N-acetylmuramoyl-L-alanine amidase